MGGMWQAWLIGSAVGDKVIVGCVGFGGFLWYVLGRLELAVAVDDYWVVA